MTMQTVESVTTEERELVSVQVTAELDVDLDTLYFDTDKKEFRPGDLNKDLIGEAIAVKSDVYENAIWGNITSVAVVPSVNAEPLEAEPPMERKTPCFHISDTEIAKSIKRALTKEKRRLSVEDWTVRDIAEELACALTYTVRAEREVTSRLREMLGPELSDRIELVCRALGITQPVTVPGGVA
jgi:hypothetical protein